MLRRLLPLALVALAACGGDRPAPEPPAPIPFRQDATLDLLRNGTATPYATLGIEIAATDSARERGLMERVPLQDDQGMLFLFDRAEPQTFWMANTPSSLDIVFVAADSTVLNVAKYTRPLSTDGVSSQGPARFVLELRAGWADAHGLASGDRLRWSAP